MKKIDFNEVCRDYGVCARTFRQIEGATPGYKQPTKAWGLSFMRDGKPVIVFDDTRAKFEQRYTVAHEPGHILLGHLSHRNQALTTNLDWCETEANIFAAVLIANDILCKYGAEAEQ